MPTDRRGRGRRRLTAAAAVALALVCGGCAMVPTSSSPRTADENSGKDTLSQPYVRMIAAPPKDGYLPDQIVKGFQAAMASFDDADLKVAREYMTPPAAQKWNPWQQTQVYEGKIELDRPSDLKGATGAVVSLTGRLVATIDPEGVYRSVSAPLNQTFGLVKANGQWRINAAPNVRLLSTDDLDRAYRQVDLCFPPATGAEGLVVDRVWVPIEPSMGVPETRIRRLLAGPTASISKAVTSAIPEGTSLNGITVEGDTVVIDLTSPVESISSDDLDEMKAQLVWTLGDLVTGRGVEVRVNGEKFRGSGLRFRPGDYSSFDPNVLSSSAPIYFVRDGKLDQAKEKEKSGGVPVPGAAGEQQALKDPAVSGDLFRVAARADGDGVYVADMIRGHEWRRWIPGKKLTAPSWDRYGAVWTAETYGLQQSRVWESTGGQPQKVDIPEELATARIDELRVARDGARVAMVIDDGLGPTVKIGTVVRSGGRTQIGDLQTLIDARENQKIEQIAWQDAAELLVLSQGAGGQELTTWSVMEGKAEPGASIKLDAKIASIAAAPGHVLADDGNGTVLNYPIEKKVWSTVAKDGAATPVYPLG